MIQSYQYNFIEFLYQVISTGSLRTLSITRDIFFISACYSFEKEGFNLIGSAILYGFKMNQIIKRQLFKLPILQRLKELRNSDVKARDSFNLTIFVFSATMSLITIFYSAILSWQYMSLAETTYKGLLSFIELLNRSAIFNYVGYIFIKILSEDCNSYFIETISNIDPVLYIGIALAYHPKNPWTNFYIIPLSGNSFTPSFWHICIPFASVVLMSLRAFYMCGYMMYLDSNMIYSKISPIYTLKELVKLTIQSGGKSISSIFIQMALLSLAKHSGYIREVSLIEAARGFANTLVNCIKKWCSMNIIHSSIISKNFKCNRSIITAFKNVVTTIPITISLMITGFISSWFSNYYFNDTFGINLPMTVITLCFILEHIFLFPNIYCDILSPGLKYWNTTRKEHSIQKSINIGISKFNSIVDQVGLGELGINSLFTRSNLPYVQSAIIASVFCYIGKFFDVGIELVIYYFALKTFLYLMELYTTFNVLYEGLLYSISYEEYKEMAKKSLYNSANLAFEFIKKNVSNMTKLCSLTVYISLATFSLSRHVPILRKAFSVDLISLYNSFPNFPGFHAAISIQDKLKMGVSDAVGYMIYFSNINQIFTGIQPFLTKMFGFQTSGYDTLTNFFGQGVLHPEWMRINQIFKTINLKPSVAKLSIFNNLLGCLFLSIFAITYGFYLFNKVVELKMINTSLTNTIYEVNKKIELISTPENSKQPLFYLESSNYNDEEYQQYISESQI